MFHSLIYSYSNQGGLFDGFSTRSMKSIDCAVNSIGMIARFGKPKFDSASFSRPHI